MISGSVVLPFQKGPCGEGGRMRGFLFPLLEEALVVVVLVLLLILKKSGLFCKNRGNFFVWVMVLPDRHVAKE